jgi:collagen type III alpha
MIKIGEDYNGLIKNLKFWNYAKSFLFTFTSFITYSYTGSDQTVNVPSGVTHVKVILKGAGGGHGYNSSSYNNAIGGTGGYTETEIELPSGTTSLTLIVGQGGDSTVNTSKTYGGGGGSGNDGDATGGRGGGRTAIRIGSTEIATAGGGSGGAYNNSDSSKNPGFNGGGLIALGGTNPQGGGGTQTTGGSAGQGSSRNGEAGAQYEGGTGSITGTGWGGAGGGGGWYGGGGGGGLSGHHGVGGGGSGFAGRDGSTVLSGNERGSTSAYADTTQRSDSVNNCKYKNVKVLRGGGSAGQVLASGTINHGVAEIAWGS